MDSIFKVFLDWATGSLPNSVTIGLIVLAGIIFAAVKITSCVCKNNSSKKLEEKKLELSKLSEDRKYDKTVLEEIASMKEDIASEQKEQKQRMQITSLKSDFNLWVSIYINNPDDINQDSFDKMHKKYVVYKSIDDPDNPGCPADGSVDEAFYKLMEIAKKNKIDVSASESIHKYYKNGGKNPDD